MEQKHALSCLHILVKYSKQELWQLLPGLPPIELVHQLQTMCWRHTADILILKLLVQVLQAVAESLLPFIAPTDVTADPDPGIAQAAANTEHSVPADQAKSAVGTCLRLLLVQLPGSSVMALLIRALALQVRLHKGMQEHVEWLLSLGRCWL